MMASLVIQVPKRDCWKVLATLNMECQYVPIKSELENETKSMHTNKRKLNNHVYLFLSFVPSETSISS